MFYNKKAVVLGLGVTGQSVVDFLKRNGCQVFVWDEVKGLDPFNGSLDVEDQGNVGLDPRSLDFAVKSPGIHLDHKVVSTLKDNNVEITTDLDIFLDEHANSKIIAVTGTDGKSTVSYYTYEILKKEGFDVVLGGNFGYPVLTLPNAEIYVLEVSSYQLASLAKDRDIEVACITNIAYDHIAFHGNMENYTKAKARIFNVANTRLLGTRDEYTQTLVDIYDDVMVCGPDNKDLIINICKKFDISEEVAIRHFDEIKPLEHRIEPILQKNGFTIINDSKSTNLHSLLYALDRVDKNVILIMGGQTKGEDFSVLNKQRDKIKKIYLIGEAAQKLGSYITDIPCEIAGTLEVATSKINLNPGDTLLFSPACASFDQFDNYQHRGSEFKRLINARFC